MEGLHRDRRRAGSFGAAAEQYERHRPSYPTALVDDLVEVGARSVLDVGCGTGKAGRLLVARGSDVLGLEPDARMATIARRHGLVVEEARFESWDPAGRRFDLVVSGQAWHWVDPATGPAKAAGTLREDGHLAVFWNRAEPPPAVRDGLADVYRRLAPEISAPAVTRPHPEQIRERLRAIERSARFGTVELRTYPWEDEVDTKGFVGLAATHSDHALLPTERREALLAGIGGVIDVHGGSVPLTYTTALILAGGARAENR